MYLLSRSSAAALGLLIVLAVSSVDSAASHRRTWGRLTKLRNRFHDILGSPSSAEHGPRYVKAHGTESTFAREFALFGQQFMESRYTTVADLHTLESEAREEFRSHVQGMSTLAAPSNVTSFPAYCADGVTACPAVCPPGAACTLAPSCCYEAYTCNDGTVCPGRCPPGKYCARPPQCCIDKARCEIGGPCKTPLVFIPPTSNCSFVRLMVAALECHVNLNNTAENIKSALDKRCNATSACRKALANIDREQCARADLFTAFTAAGVLQDLDFMCIVDKNGDYCASGSQVEDWARPEVPSANPACRNNTNGVVCSKIGTCRWTGLRCVPTPTTQQLDKLCGECAQTQKFLNAKALALVVRSLYSTFKSDPDHYSEVDPNAQSSGSARRGIVASMLKGSASGRHAPSVVHNIMQGLSRGDVRALSKLSAVETPLADTADGFGTVDEDVWNNALAVEERLVCMKVDAGYCIQEPFQAQSFSTRYYDALNGLTNTKLKQYCSDGGRSRCARKQDEMISELAFAYGQIDSLVELPDVQLCRADAQGNFCLPQVMSRLSRTTMATCLKQAANMTCSADCVQEFRSGIAAMGCCSGLFGDVVSWLGLMQRTQNLTSTDLPPWGGNGPVYAHDVANCKGLEFVGTVLPKQCSSPAEWGSTNTRYEVHATVLFPCRLLDLNRQSIISALTDDFARMGGTSRNAIVDMHLTCSQTTFMLNGAPVPRLHRALHHPSRLRYHAMLASSVEDWRMSATDVVFSVRGGVQSDVIRSAIQTKLTAASASSYVFESVEQFVSPRCPACPRVLAQATTTNSAALPAAPGSCDPLAYLDVLNNCITPFMQIHSLNDTMALQSANKICNSTDACGSALDRLGRDNLAKYCPADENTAMLLPLLSTMCERNELNTPCMVYLRESDLDKQCKRMTYSKEDCNAQPGCIHLDGECVRRPLVTEANAACGKCSSAVLRAEMLRGRLNFGPSLTLQCQQVDGQYCFALEQQYKINGVSMLDAPNAAACNASIPSRCMRQISIAYGAVLEQIIAGQEASCVGNTCAATISELHRARSIVEYAVEFGCATDNSGANCFDLGDKFVLKNTDLSACYAEMFMVGRSCTSNCSTKLRSAVDRLGCCASAVQGLLERNQTRETDFIDPNAAQQSPPPKGLMFMEPCIADISTMLQRSPCVMQMVTLRKGLALAVTATEVPQATLDLIQVRVGSDIALAAGVAKSAISDVRVALIPGYSAGTSAHHFQALATASPVLHGIQVDYTIGATDVTALKAASLNIDTKVQAGTMNLIATQSAVQETCATCGSLTIDTKSSRTIVTVPSGAAGLLTGASSFSLLFTAAMAIIVLIILL